MPVSPARCSRPRGAGPLWLGAKRLDAIVSRQNAVGVSFWESDGFELHDDNGRWSALL